MEGDPVIGEDGVGCKGFGGIVDDRDIDIVVAEDVDKLVKFLLVPAFGVDRAATGRRC